MVDYTVLLTTIIGATIIVLVSLLYQSRQHSHNNEILIINQIHAIRIKARHTIMRKINNKFCTYDSILRSTNKSLKINHIPRNEPLDIKLEDDYLEFKQEESKR